MADPPPETWTQKVFAVIVFVLLTLCLFGLGSR